MKNILRLIALCFLVTSCNYEIKKPVVTNPVEEKPVELPPMEVEEPKHEASKPIGPEYPVADVKKVFTVKIEDTNYTADQKKKLALAEKVLAKIVNSPEYEVEVLSRKFTSTNLSSKEVYEKLFRGAEGLQPAVNYQMDLKVTMYLKKLSKVVGYTYPNTLIVYTNSKFHNGYSVCQVASNLFHEWTHKMGFDHSSASDSKSVPYSHNDIVEKLCPKFL